MKNWTFFLLLSKAQKLRNNILVTRLTSNASVSLHLMQSQWQNLHTNKSTKCYQVKTRCPYMEHKHPVLSASSTSIAFFSSTRQLFMYYKFYYKNKMFVSPNIFLLLHLSWPNWPFRSNIWPLSFLRIDTPKVTFRRDFNSSLVFLRNKCFNPLSKNWLIVKTAAASSFQNLLGTQKCF